MKKLQTIIKYIIVKNNNTVTKEFLLYILFLFDWKYALNNKKPYTNLKWKINKSHRLEAENYSEILNSLSNIDVEKINNLENTLFHYDKNSNFSLKSTEKLYLDYILRYIKKSDLKLEDLVNITYPVYSYHNRDFVLDLEKISEDYRRNVRPNLEDHEN